MNLIAIWFSLERQVFDNGEQSEHGIPSVYRTSPQCQQCSRVYTVFVIVLYLNIGI